MRKYAKMAWRNVWRNWRRTAIAISAIILGLILLILMDAMIQGSDQAMFGNAVRLYGGNVQIHAPGFRAKSSRLPLIPLADDQAVLAAVRAQPEVVSVSRRINTGGLISQRGSTHPVTITGIEPSVEAPVSLAAQNVSQGRFLQDEDQDGILIGKGLADYLGVSLGDRVAILGKQRDGSMRQHGMTVVGVYNLGLPEAERGIVYINLNTAQTLFDLRDQVTEVTLSLETVGREEGLMETLQGQLPDYEVDSWKTLQPDIQDTLRIKSLFTNVFGFIVLLIASIGILNLMMMAVLERTRELGVLAALGWKGKQIMSLLLLEGMSIGAVGGMIGCVVGGLLMMFLARVGIDFSFATEMGGEITALMGSRLYPYITLLDFVGYGLSTILIAGLATLLPAWSASKSEPADSLHHV